MNYNRENGKNTACKPIGIFDSGIGGLTVVKEIIKILPREDILYLGDTARVPYGIRSPDTVMRYALENTEFLLHRGIKMLVVACNTVSAIGLDTLEEKTDIPVVGVLNPGAKAAIKATKKGRIGIIGTEATISSNAYQRAIRSFGNSTKVFGTACSLFVPLVEEGLFEGKITELIVERYLSDLKSRDIDTLVLGCTHYPMLKKQIRAFMGYGVILIDSAVETAQTVRDILTEAQLLNNTGPLPERRFFVTDSPGRFQRIGATFLGNEITEIERVAIPRREQHRNFYQHQEER